MSLLVASILTDLSCSKAIWDAYRCPQPVILVSCVSGIRCYNLMLNVLMLQRLPSGSRSLSRSGGTHSDPVRSGADTVPCAAQSLLPAGLAQTARPPPRRRVSPWVLSLGGSGPLCSEQVVNWKAAWLKAGGGTFLRNLTLCLHFAIMKFIILKKFRCLLLLREKGCFSLYKAASCVSR